ncbi:hypothetical protein [Pseudomonas phage PPAY]|nr:hypothetical protein [Pseudomonas phage PPAY]UCW44430.1 hypothetical protein [Pseudomonas phage PPAT]
MPTSSRGCKMNITINPKDNHKYLSQLEVKDLFTLGGKAYMVVDYWTAAPLEYTGSGNGVVCVSLASGRLIGLSGNVLVIPAVGDLMVNEV